MAIKTDYFRPLDKPGAQLNAIPIELQYQLDIYTKTVEEGDEYF